MAAKSVLKSSTSAVLAAVMAMGLLLPAAASAQEDRGQGGMRRMERMERMQQRGGMSAPAPTRSAPPAMPTMSRQMDRPAPSAAPAPQRQAQAWQGQAPQWQGRGQASAAQQGWNGGRPSWQQGNRGGGFGRPGDAAVPSANGATNNPVPVGRNPTYADPRRNPGNGVQTGQQGWNQNRNGNWNRDANRGSNRDWNRDGNRDGNRNWANGANRGRDWNRDRDRNWNRNGDWNRGRDWNRNGYASNQWRGNNWNNNGGWNNNRGWNGNWDNRRWDRNGWRRDNRYNWLGWRNSHRDFFRGGFYSAPFGGYSYSRLSIGLFLGNAFFDQQYWIADPYAYRLPPAYQPYQWVRYYNDVVLVDTYTGEVVDVIYDFFW